MSNLLKQIEIVKLKKTVFSEEDIALRIRTTKGDFFDFDRGSILEGLQKNGIYLPASCGGKGSCGRCKIKVLDGRVNSLSFFGISEKERERGYVLACQSYPESELLVEIPQNLVILSERISKARDELIKRKFKEAPKLLNPILKKTTLTLEPPTLENSISDFDRVKTAFGSNLSLSLDLAKKLSNYLRDNNWKVTFAYSDNRIVQFLKENQKIYSVAIDIGTTTIALALIDMERASVVEHATCYNSQISYGDDVITRIVYTIENDRGLETLRNAVIDDINALINTVKIRYSEGKILYITLSGNTTMCHIFWGISPKYIREEPYVPTFSHYPLWTASQVSLELEPEVPIYTIPSVAGYVGGDIVSGVLASGMYEEESLCLFIDIGTNGEIVIGNRDWLVTASTSAGPCFEGSGISCGMRAVEGAVESFVYDKIEDSFKLRVIGDKVPSGICGSGMIDIVYELFNAGVINNKGKLIPNSSKHVEQKEEELKFTLSEKCFITQSDVDNIVRAKAAIYAGISTALEEVGVKERDIEKVYIAGGFGEFLDVKKAVGIGMLPNLPLERFHFLGNTSLAGAILCLLSRDLRDKAEEIAEIMTYIDLSSSKRFIDEYMSSLFLPHTDLERFKKS